MSEVLQLKNISKHFAGVHALAGVNFSLVEGEVHALLGENGAGKSTLIKVMTGAYSLDSGEIRLNAKKIQPGSPADAQAVGISPVYQEVNLLPNLSVAHNLYLGREPKRFGCIQWKKIHRDAANLLKRFKLDIDVTRSLASYSVAIQQLVAIARGVDCSAKVLILDEPTASLDSDEVALLFDILRELKASGMAIIFVTHFLDQVYALCDRITVLRNGKLVGTYACATLPRPQLVAHMLGKELQEIESQPAKTRDQNETLLEVKNLQTREGLQHASFKASKGEALGLAGLLGSGRSELCEALFGLAQRRDGEIKFNGQALHLGKPAEAIKLHFALCPEDRKQEGIIAELSIRENIILALQARNGWWRAMTLQAQKKLANQYIQDLNIVCPHAEKALGELSGGNQQKVILARWLCTQPQLLILDEPTRGIDIGAHAEIIKLIRELCSQGLTLIVASSEIEELLAFSHKVLVMRDRRSHSVVEGEQLNEADLLRAIAH